MWRLSLLSILFPCVAWAESSSVIWVTSRVETPLIVTKPEEWRNIGDTIIVVDPLTWNGERPADVIEAPASLAKFYAFIDQETGRTSKVMLVFSNSEPVCGVEKTALGVDGGMGAFLASEAEVELNSLSHELSQTKQDIYTGFFEKIFKDKFDFAEIVTLPSGAHFPVFTTGWGDGWYPVSILYDDRGTIVAIFADFMGKNDKGEWLLPEDCSQIMT